MVAELFEAGRRLTCALDRLVERAVAQVDPRELDLPNLRMTVFKNGAPISQGLGSAVQGNPLTAVAWLANTLGAFGIPFKAGEIILSGSLVPLEPACAGDRFELTIDGLGSARVSFRD